MYDVNTLLSTAVALHVYTMLCCLLTNMSQDVSATQYHGNCMHKLHTLSLAVAQALNGR
jgi:hypothetical protein